MAMRYRPSPYTPVYLGQFQDTHPAMHEVIVDGRTIHVEAVGVRREYAPGHSTGRKRFVREEEQVPTRGKGGF